MSNLIVSFVESSNLCILGIIFLGSYLAFISVGVLVLVVIFMTSSGLSKTDFVRKTCFVFGGENITGSSLRKVPHFAMCG